MLLKRMRRALHVCMNARRMALEGENPEVQNMNGGKMGYELIALF